MIEMILGGARWPGGRGLLATVGVLSPVAGLILSQFVLAVGPATATTNTGSTIAKAVSVGVDHACALTGSGGVKCWGENGAGGLGDDTITNSGVPVDVRGLGTGVKAITAGGGHTCALTDSGGVLCWGYNYNGQLGDGTRTDSPVPVDVKGLASGVVAISAGDFHTCALTDSGRVKCWGGDGHGQLGDGSTARSTVPVDVKDLASRVVAISAGADHTCALADSGRVKCWGANGSGELGDGTSRDSSVPVEVKDLGSGATVISAGAAHTCALTNSERVKCWGSNFFGQLGNGTQNSSPVPVDVKGLGSGAMAVDAGGFHTCALTGSGVAKCWGQNMFGQLGDGTRTDSSVPVDVKDLASGVKVISADGVNACALTASGGVKCWGSNSSGQLGNNGREILSSVPVNVSGLG